jgi:archaellin
MKKIVLFLMALALFAGATQAQSTTVFPLVAGDSISTSNSLDTVSKTISVTAGYSTLGIQVVTTKISGTVAGKAYLYASMDGTNYVLTDSSAAFANQTTNTALFSKSPTPYRYYQVQVRTQGADGSTQVNRVRVYYALRKHNN